MQIRLLFLSVPRAPPPSSGVHCTAGPLRIHARTYVRERCLSTDAHVTRAHTLEYIVVATSILIIIYAVARGSDIIIVRTRVDSIDEDYAGYSPRAGQTVVERLYTYRAASIRVHSLYDGPRKRECDVLSFTREIC